MKLRKFCYWKKVKGNQHGFFEAISNQERKRRRDAIKKKLKAVARMLNLYRHVQKKKYNSRLGLYLKKPKLPKLYYKFRSLMVVMKLYKFIQKRKVTRQQIGFFNERVHKNLRKWRTIVKAYLVLKNIAKEWKQRKALGSKYGLRKRLWHKLRLKIRCFMIFKRFLKFKRKKIGSVLKKKFNVAYGRKLKVIFFALSTFLKLYKHIRRRRVTLSKQKFYNKNPVEEIRRTNIVLKKFKAAAIFLHLLYFVRNKRLTMKKQSYLPEKRIFPEKKRSSKFKTLSLCVLALLKLRKKAYQQKLVAKRCNLRKLKLKKLFKLISVWLKLLKFVRHKKITRNFAKNFSQEYFEDRIRLRLLKPLVPNIPTLLLLLGDQKIEKKRGKLRLPNVVLLVLTLLKLYKRAKENKSRPKPKEEVITKVTISIPKVDQTKEISEQ